MLFQHSSEPIHRDVHVYFLTMLNLVATRATCSRRAVACIITDDRNHILSTGYNGPPRGIKHCTDEPCIGANDVPGDTSNCMAVHAEANALLQCHRLDMARTVYCSASPCFACAKMIANTDIRNVFYVEEYADKRGIDVLRQVGVRVIHAPQAAA